MDPIYCKKWMYTILPTFIYEFILLNYINVDNCDPCRNFDIAVFL